MIGNLFNILWVITWVQNTVASINASAIMLFLILVSNLIILWKAKSFKPENGHNIYEIIFVDVTFSIYASWTTVASILNFSIALLVDGYDGGAISASAWGVIMIVIAAVINILMLIR